MQDKKIRISPFTIIKPTSEEKALKKYKGGDWYVRRTGSYSGLLYFPAGWKGLTYSWFSLISIFGLGFWLINSGLFSRGSLWPAGITVAYSFVLSFIAEHKTYKPRKTWWHTYKLHRRLYKEKKGIFKRP